MKIEELRGSFLAAALEDDDGTLLDDLRTRKGPEAVDALMARMEAEADRAGTIRDEENKMRARAAMESPLSLPKEYWDRLRETDSANRPELRDEDLKRFVLGGRAIFTVVSKETGTRFTYRINTNKHHTCYFVAVLTGSSNETDYSYIGFIRSSEAETFVHGGEKARAGHDAPSVLAFGWFWRRVVFPVQAPSLAGKVEVYHEGRCGRCGRRLTVPESIRTGFGPECATRA